MSLRVAINGFGRIGKLTLRAAFENGYIADHDIEIVAINDLGELDVNAILLQNDSVHGRFLHPVDHNTDTLKIKDHHISYFHQANPADLPWKELDIDLVMECSGKFTNKTAAQIHLQAGAKRVLVSAPCQDADATIVYGVNHEDLKAAHQIISNASCTTNCLAPLAQALHQSVGIEKGFMTTVHAFTGDQNLNDGPHKDPRRARSALTSMIPTTTGAARAVGLVLPDLKGKLDGTSIRVPTPNVSVVDLTFHAQRPTRVEDINQIVMDASTALPAHILDVMTQPLVSIDLNHHKASSIFDPSGTHVIDGTLVRVLSWYDNEWGFSNRMWDTALKIAALERPLMDEVA